MWKARVRRMNRAVKIRIYPNKEQRVQIEKTIGCSRFIYNQMLAEKISYYQKEKKMLRNTPAGYKKEYPWLKFNERVLEEAENPENPLCERLLSRLVPCNGWVVMYKPHLV